jgi:hypothetical protein
VDLDFIGDIRRAADQPIRSRALVLDGQVSAADFRATAWRGSGLRDHEIAGFTSGRAQVASVTAKIA